MPQKALTLSRKVDECKSLPRFTSGSHASISGTPGPMDASECVASPMSTVDRPAESPAVASR